MQHHNPNLKPQVSNDKPPKIPKVTDGDKKRGIPVSSSSEDEVVCLPNKRDRAGSVSDSSSGSSSSSSHSESNESALSSSSDSED